MAINNTKVDVYIDEIKMIRPGSNFGKGEHNLNVDWSIDYTIREDEITEYICTLAAIGETPLKFAIHGFLDCENHRKDLEERYHELSPLILDRCMKTMIDILNATKNTSVNIKTVPEVYLTCVYGKL